MAISDGKVEARVPSAIYDANPAMRDILHDGLNDRFLGVQLLSHEPYELSKATMTRVYPGGRKEREIVMEVEPGHFRLSGSLDFQHIDRNGNVVADSRRERIEQKKSLAELVSAHRANDGLLGSLLKSYKASVHDPDNELVHLYEIKDALSAKLGSDKAARVTLSISSSEWSRFGKLCNKEPLRQGRHRGQSAGALREASEAELTEARGIARSMVEAYLRHLEKSVGTGAP